MMKIVTVALSFVSMTSVHMAARALPTDPVTPPSVRVDSLVVQNGNGFGSALALVPGRTGEFYLMTDRGPNVDGPSSNTKIFLQQDYAPRIGRFRITDRGLELLGTIDLKNRDGKKLTGLPHPAGEGGTGETAFDTLGRRLAPDEQGIDPEGLAAMPDGTFWVSDEYGPHLLHLDARGRTLERLSPFSGPRSLPRVLARRKPNRGMEGLTATPGGRYLAGIMQGPLLNPDAAAVSGSRNVRLVLFDQTTGRSMEYLYVLDHAGMRVSDIAAVDEQTFLVLERDDTFLGADAEPVKRIYKISLNGATNLNDPANGPSGLLFNGKTAEQLEPAQLEGLGVHPVQKVLAADIMQAIPGYPHDKAEGLAVIDRQTIALSNDNDFGITDGGNGSVSRKILPATGQVDRNVVYFIRLDKPL
ncbi:MAG TPA: esterase-like activity of phytase family protein [Chitinophagaceae bacterium]|jgi:hypothetical protein|nr:esterase-like activity of phytase family protein [Chitinophagaceae bacterium]